MRDSAVTAQVRDKRGAVFGGYAADAWAKRGTFYGSPMCFLFSLAPRFALHFASGVNGHYQWCGHRFNELPNGIGFGGQVRPHPVILQCVRHLPTRMLVASTLPAALSQQAWNELHARFFSQAQR